MAHQKPTGTERRVWMGMARLVSHLSREAGRAVQEAEGVTLSEMTLMGQVRGLGGGARLVELAARLQLTKPAITKIVDSLETQGYLERQPDVTDGRVVLAALTASGRKVLGSAERAFEAVMRRGLWDRLDREEAERLADVLDRLQGELGLPGGGLMPPTAE